MGEGEDNRIQEEEIGLLEPKAKLLQNFLKKEHIDTPPCLMSFGTIQSALSLSSNFPVKHLPNGQMRSHNSPAKRLYATAYPVREPDCDQVSRSNW